MMIKQLEIEEHPADIKVTCVFTIPTDSYLFRTFRRESLEFRSINSVVVLIDDYLQYLFDEDECTTDYLDDKYFIKETENSRRWIAPPSPYSNLLVAAKKQRLVEVTNNCMFQYDTVKNEFSYLECVDNNRTTQGILADLKDLEKEINNSSTSNEQFLLNLLKSLDLHWN